MINIEMDLCLSRLLKEKKRLINFIFLSLDSIHIFPEHSISLQPTSFLFNPQ